MKKYNKFLIIILISLVCEIFLFNYSFFITLFNKQIIYINDSKESIFELENINQKVNYIKLEANYERYAPVSINATDEANSNYYQLNKKEIMKDNKKSLYQSIHPVGKVKNLQVISSLGDNVIDRVIINPKVPMMFSVVRFIIILIILSIIYLLKSKSKIFEIRLFEKKGNKLIIAEILLVLSIILGMLCVTNDYFVDITTSNQKQYNRLTESIKHKRLYIKEVKNSFLLKMDNPYDTVERYKLSVKTGEDYLWDYSFYNNKYYVYFGIGPVLLTYLPYNILTGNQLSNTFVDFIFIIASMFSITYLLYNICKKWFKDVRLVTFLMCIILMISSCGIFYVIKRPDFYNVPIIISLFFVTFGLGIFISATTTDKLFKTKLVIASSCMAFVALCRPQFLIASFLIIPLYWDYFVKKFDKKKIKELLCIIIPYIIFAVLTCTYNYLRFGNIFDFGVNYNLTSNDMTKRGFVLGRIPLGILYYLLIPFRILPVFPFIEPIPLLENNYFGRTIYEKMSGGFFFTHAITILSLFIMKFKSYFKDKKLYWFSVLSVIFGLIVVIVDTEMAGILPRYFTDFGYLLLIPTAIIIFSLEKTIFKNKILRNLLIVFILFALIYESLTLFVDTAPSIKDTMQKTYMYFYYLFC